MTLRAILMALGCVVMSALVSACGRAGEPLRPAPGVVVMQPEAEESAPQSEDRPFILDSLL